MKKEIKNFGKFIEIMLIILTFISLIFSFLEYTNMLYSWTYDTANLNNLVISTPFTIILFIDNILIYIVSIFYIIDTVQKKNNLLLKISFCLCSIGTTIISSTFITNGIAKIFHII